MRAAVTCRDGSVYRTEALIAADGLWSLARRTLFSDDQVQTPKYVAYRGTIPTSEVTMYARPDDLLIWAGPDMHLVQYPVRGGEALQSGCCIQERSVPQSTATIGARPEELDRHFSKACPYVIGAVNEVGRGRRWPLFDRNPINPLGQEQGGAARRCGTSDAAVSGAGCVPGVSKTPSALRSVWIGMRPT